MTHRPTTGTAGDTGGAPHRHTDHWLLRGRRIAQAARPGALVSRGPYVSSRAVIARAFHGQSSMPFPSPLRRRRVPGLRRTTPRRSTNPNSRLPCLSAHRQERKIFARSSAEDPCGCTIMPRSSQDTEKILAQSGQVSRLAAFPALPRRPRTGATHIGAAARPDRPRRTRRFAPPQYPLSKNATAPRNIDGNPSGPGRAVDLNEQQRQPGIAGG